MKSKLSWTTLDQAGLKLDQLDQEISKADKAVHAKKQDIAVLEEKENTLKVQTEVLERNLDQKSNLLEQLQELDKLGFGEESFRALHTALVETGTKRGLKPSEAVNTFFADLKDYDAKTGFEREIQRLGSITETKKLEAENWQAKAERLESQYGNLKEAIEAMQALLKRGVKAEQIVSWNGIVSKLGGPEELQDKLGQYKSMSELLNAYGLRLTKAQSQLETLEKEKTKIEGAIESLREAGIKQLKAMTEATEKQLKAVAATEIKEAQNVAREIRSEFATFFTQLDKLSEKAVHLGQELGKSKQELRKYEGVKEALESHAVAMEEAK